MTISMTKKGVEKERGTARHRAEFLFPKTDEKKRQTHQTQKIRAHWGFRSLYEEWIRNDLKDGESVGKKSSGEKREKVSKGTMKLNFQKKEGGGGGGGGLSQ